LVFRFQPAQLVEGCQGVIPYIWHGKNKIKCKKFIACAPEAETVRGLQSKKDSSGWTRWARNAFCVGHMNLLQICNPRGVTDIFNNGR
jgi:hypothetical protein